MRRPSPSLPIAAVMVGALLCACGHHDAGTNAGSDATQQHRSALVNPSTFPLYRGAAVVTVVPVDSAQILAAMRANDPKGDLPRNYRGHEVIAETSATTAQLQSWLRALKAAPPRGLRDTSASVHRSRSDGDDGFDMDTDSAAKFDSTDGTRTVFVFTADPHVIRRQMGAAFALFDSYGAVPGMLRAPIDDQAKKQFGYTVTEMLDPGSPIGAAIATLKRMQNVDRRAILLIDESRA